MALDSRTASIDQAMTRAATSEAVTTLPARGARAEERVRERAYLPPLDGLRAFAVISVLVGHLVPFEPIQRLVGWGDVGVVIFFVLSGFLITDILLRAEASTTSRSGLLRAFYARRFLRIFPIYYLAIAAAAVLGYEPVRENLVRLATYTLNLPGLPVTTDLGVAAHLWSLSVEEQFYIVWPLALLVTPRERLRVLLAAVIAASVVLKVGLVASGASYAEVFRPITGCMDSLAAGALVAVLRRERSGPLVSRRLVAVALGGALAVTIARMASGLDPWYTGRLDFAILQFATITASTAIAIAYVIDRRGALANALGHPALRPVARVSYGLYVYHFFVPALLGGLMVGPDYLQSLVHLTGTVVLAAASWRYIEAPILRFKDRVPYGQASIAS
jgi:peptidoglycan/LPS O-acetylase OafA/YrhL